MNEKILITSALPYANGPLHFGHIAGAYLPADCYARFQRLMQNDVLFICGSDEYGVAITLSADLAGRSPQEHVNIFHEINKKLFETLQISFDHYSRTTTKYHQAPVHQFFLELMGNGYIEERVTEQLFSEADSKFLADRYVVGTCPRCGYQKARGDECPECGASYEATDLINPRSKLTGSQLVRKSTKHWFLLLDKFKERLTQWIENKPWKPNVINFIKGYIQDMHARSITRDGAWGVPLPLPGTEGKVIYVWFEALIGYVSGTMEWADKQGKPERWKDYWFDAKTKLVHFIGKDNIPFHATIFPAMIMGQNQPYIMVDQLPANEFLKLEGRQFSKSEGWYIDLDDFFTRYTVDQARYAIAANAPETADSEFTWKEFQTRCNTELLGKYGNLVNRVLVFAKNNCASKVPSSKTLEAIDEKFLAEVRALADHIAEAYSTFRVRRACQLVMELAQLGNVYFDTKKPWQDAKSEATRPRMETTIACCLQCLKTLALASFPVIPDSASQVWKMLGYAKALDSQAWQEVLETPIPQGQTLLEPRILFQKIEDDQIAKEIATLHQMAAQHETAKPINYAPLKDPVEIEEVRKLDLRVGIVKEAKPVPKSKKLLQLQVDLGFEQRTVVAGIGQSYQPDELIGKKVVVVANLKPATLMGVESQGMLLAGHSEGSLETIAVTTLPPGSVVS